MTEEFKQSPAEVVSTPPTSSVIVTQENNSSTELLGTFTLASQPSPAVPASNETIPKNKNSMSFGATVSSQSVLSVNFLTSSTELDKKPIRSPEYREKKKELKSKSSHSKEVIEQAALTPPLKSQLSALQKEFHTFNEIVSLLSQLCVMAIYYEKPFHPHKSIGFIQSNLKDYLQKIDSTQKALQQKCEALNINETNGRPYIKAYRRLENFRLHSKRFQKILSFLQQEPVKNILERYELDRSEIKLSPRHRVLPDEEKLKTIPPEAGSTDNSVTLFLHHCQENNLFSFHTYYFEKLFFCSSFQEFKDRYDKKLKTLQRDSLPKQIEVIEQFFRVFQLLYNHHFFSNKIHAESVAYLYNQLQYTISLNSLHQLETWLPKQGLFDRFIQSLINPNNVLFDSYYFDVIKDQNKEHIDALLWAVFDFLRFQRKLLSTELVNLKSTSNSGDSKKSGTHSSSGHQNSRSPSKKTDDSPSKTLSSVRPAFTVKLRELQTKLWHNRAITVFIEQRISGYKVLTFPGGDLFKAIFKTCDAQQFAQFFNSSFGGKAANSSTKRFIHSLMAMYDLLVARLDFLETALKSKLFFQLNPHEHLLQEQMRQYDQCRQMLILVGKKVVEFYKQSVLPNGLASSRAADEKSKGVASETSASLRPTTSIDAEVQKEYRQLIGKVQKQFIKLDRSLSQKITLIQTKLAENKREAINPIEKNMLIQQNAQLKRELDIYTKQLTQCETIIEGISSIQASNPSWNPFSRWFQSSAGDSKKSSTNGITKEQEPPQTPLTPTSHS